MELNKTQFPVIKHSDLTAGGQDSPRAPQVSPDEFQAAARQGYNQVRVNTYFPTGTAGLDEHWDSIVDAAYKSAQSEWGGGTFNAATGKPVDDNADAYALTARAKGQSTIHVSPNVNRQQFGAAMDKARTTFAQNLNRRGGHLGVFHDAEAGRIDIDPVHVTDSLEESRNVGAYTGNVGGAYHFKSGNGYWPPSVKD